MPYNSFSIQNFEKILDCPEGQEPVRSDFNPKSEIFSAHFDLKICSQCLLKEQCPVKFQKKDTVLRVSQKSLIAKNTRLTIQNEEERRESGSKRAAVEGTNSVLKRARGTGKLKVRGLVRKQPGYGLKNDRS
ncbi:transposase [Paradesulfitobacterium ferrireducens]|uniref:transposase n=1 Tax=Paradesulfitobacterium ferrireducens TaxID=2816476 RepID=UPI001A8DECC5|nr:transposase [Paradesulfitobacterium ferrireducens]